jgi:hypothetical protein
MAGLEMERPPTGVNRGGRWCRVKRRRQGTARGGRKSTHAISEQDVKALAEASRNVALANRSIHRSPDVGVVVPRSKAFYAPPMVAEPVTPARKKAKLGRPQDDAVRRSVWAAIHRKKGVKLETIAGHYRISLRTLKKRISDARKRNAE